MKNIIFTILFSALMIGELSAQISFRPQVGVNSPSITKDLVQGKFKGNLGYSLGVDLMIGDEFYIQPGLIFETNKIEFANFGDIRVSRLNVPILIGGKLTSSIDDLFGIRLFTGPSFSFNINEKLDDSIEAIDKDDIRDAQIGWNIGLGADLTIFFVDIGYKFGLSKFFENINSDARNNQFYGNAGLRIGF